MILYFIEFLHRLGYHYFFVRYSPTIYFSHQTNLPKFPVASATGPLLVIFFIIFSTNYFNTFPFLRQLRSNNSRLHVHRHKCISIAISHDLDIRLFKL